MGACLLDKMHIRIIFCVPYPHPKWETTPFHGLTFSIKTMYLHVMISLLFPGANKVLEVTLLKRWSSL